METMYAPFVKLSLVKIISEYELLSYILKLLISLQVVVGMPPKNNWVG